MLVPPRLCSRAFARLSQISQTAGSGVRTADLARVGGGDPACVGTVGSTNPVVIFGAAAKFWVRGDLGITLSTGVSGWADQSLTGDPNENLSQATAANQPTYNASNSAYNNQATLSFAATSMQFMTSGVWATPLALPETVFIVGNDDGVGASNEYLSDGSALNARATSSGFGGSKRWGIYNGAILSGGTPSNAPSIYVGYFDSSTNSKIWVSAITPLATGTAGTTVATRTGLTAGAAGGGGSGLTGTIAEILVISGAPSAGNFAAVMGYFGTRYNITVGP